MINETLWHKCLNPIFPRRTADGKWTWIVGQTWRRKRPDGKWDFLQDQESNEDGCERESW